MIDLSTLWEEAGEPMWDQYRVVPAQIEFYLSTVEAIGVGDCYGHMGLEMAGFETLLVQTEAKIVSIHSRRKDTPRVSYVLVTMPPDELIEPPELEQ